LGENAGLDVCPRTIQRALAKRGYTQYKACKKPFINRKCQMDRMGYAHKHLEKPVEFWRSHMYSDESTFDTFKRGSTWIT
jgi:hypothetical protein